MLLVWTRVVITERKEVDRSEDYLEVTNRSERFKEASVVAPKCWTSRSLVVCPCAETRKKTGRGTHGGGGELRDTSEM